MWVMLFFVRGLDWTAQSPDGIKFTIYDLMTELYIEAGRHKLWWLVRHTAGILGKQSESLAISATDIIVRQKQLTVGLPRNRGRNSSQSKVQLASFVL